MKYSKEYQNPEYAEKIINRIRQRKLPRVRFMEFCGGHTVTIFRYAIRDVLPDEIEMVSGPGCPVCVTSMRDIDKAVLTAQSEDAIITTFGDMMKVPGSHSSLQEAKAEGADVRMVYSTMDALEIARTHRDRKVVFLGIGFETTAPTVAASILQAREKGIDNYSVLSMHKLSPPAIHAVLESGDVKLDGLICPGHVCAVIGAIPWENLAQKHHIPCVISGFEPLDILLAVDMIAAQIEDNLSNVEIAYRRGVKNEGNVHALNLMNRVFETSDAEWRGLGRIPRSGLKIKEEYSRFDAEKAFAVEPEESREPPGCICGEILRGVKTPLDCKLFGKKCTPESPVGACMVSAEGCCSTYFLYGGAIGK